VQEIRNPFSFYAGLDGLALELGYIRIGNENTDPDVIANQKAVWFDAAGTQAAAQPIRTLAGYPDRDGSPARLYVEGPYSIRVRNAAGEQVFYAQSAGEAEAVGAGQPYFMHVQFLGDSPSAQQVVSKHLFARDVSFETDLPDLAWFHVGTAPTGDCVFSMRYDGTEYGTLTIDTAGDLFVECDALEAEQGHYWTLVTPDAGTDLAVIGGTIEGETA
jgi:hypothetical protein